MDGEPEQSGLLRPHPPRPVPDRLAVLWLSSASTAVLRELREHKRGSFHREYHVAAMFPDKLAFCTCLESRNAGASQDVLPWSVGAASQRSSNI